MPPPAGALHRPAGHFLLMPPPIDPMAGALELRRAADSIEAHGALRRQLATKWLGAWVGGHRREFDAELARSLTEGIALAGELRAVAVRLEQSANTTPTPKL